MDLDQIGNEAVEHLRTLIRFPTFNPPGNELPAAQYIAGVLEQEGIKPLLFEPAPMRANLIARLNSTQERPPLLLHGHLDTVPVENPALWQHPPFSGTLVDGCVWGRGAIDMKSGVVMALMALIAAKRQNWPLKRDIIFAAAADEETDTQLGSRWLVQHHPDLLRAEIAVGEAGGYPSPLNGRKMFLIQAGEKGMARLTIHFAGQSGHGSVVPINHPVARAGLAAWRCATRGLPHHSTSTTDSFLRTVAAAAGPIEGSVMSLLRAPMIGKLMMLGPLRQHPRRSALSAMLANTINPNIIQGGRVINQVPEDVFLKTDVRLLPGHDSEGYLDEIKSLFAGLEPFEIHEDSRSSALESDIRHPGFQTFARQIAAHMPEARTAPYLLPGYTDASNYRHVVSQCYGFYPIDVPMDMEYHTLIHGRDERIPVHGYKWGIQVFLAAIRELCC